MELYENIIGSANQSSFRSRLVNIISFSGSILIAFITIVSHFTTAAHLTIALYITLALTIVAYIISRLLKRPRLAYVFLILVTIVGISTNYIFGSGYHGTALYWMFPATTMLALGAPKNGAQ